MSEIIFYLETLGIIISFLAIALIGVYIYQQNRAALGNRVFAGLTCCLSLWALASLFREINADPALVIWSYKLPLITGCFSIAFQLYFAFIYPEEKDISWFAKAVIFLFPVIYILLTLFTDLYIKDLVITNPAHLFMGKPIFGSLQQLYVAYSYLYLLLTLAIFSFKWSRAKGKEKIKLLFLIVAFTVGIAFVLLFSMTLPLLGYPFIFSLPLISMILSATLIAYAMVKYKLFVITPLAVGEEILNSMGKSVLVYDLKGQMIYRGQAPLLSSEIVMDIVNQVIRSGFVRNYRLVVEGTPTIASAAFIREGGGVVIVFHDLTVIEKEAIVEQTLHNKLEKKLEKEKTLRGVLTRYFSAKEDEIKNLLAEARRLLQDDPEGLAVLQAIEYVSNERAHLRAEVETKRKAVYEKIEAIEAIRVENEQLTQKMQKYIDGIKLLKRDKA